MRLSDWLSEQQVVKAAFAERVGVHPSQITRYCKGVRVPTREIARRIFRETGGAVDPNSFHDLADLDAEVSDAPARADRPPETRHTTSHAASEAA